ncbi:MAG: hypothetical protein WC545_01730 [Patescibacteria group bacterium]
MKILQKLSEEVVPLSSKQAVVLMTIIACIFQFVLFYAPALAEEAVSRQMTAEEEKWRLLGQEDALAVSEEAALEKLAGLKEEASELIVANDLVIKSAIMDPEAAKLMAEAQKTYTVVRTSVHAMTAYNSEAAQTDASPCITANGFNVCEHGIEDTIAANFLKFGTKVRIPDLFGDRIFIVRDRMNQRYPDRVDIWMKDKSDALQFGVRTARIEVIVEETKLPDSQAPKNSQIAKK